MSNLTTREEIGNNIKYSCKLSKSHIIFINHINYIFLDDLELNWNQPKLVINLMKCKKNK